MNLWYDENKNFTSKPLNHVIAFKYVVDESRLSALPRHASLTDESWHTDFLFNKTAQNILLFDDAGYIMC